VRERASAVSGRYGPASFPAGRRGVFAVIAGGGTGGHVVPAIAIGRALVERGHPPSSIRFVGSRRGIEGRLVPDAGFALTVLPGRGLVRRVTVANVGAVVGLVSAVARAVVLVRRMRPSVVVSVGGYASVAATVAAAVWRVPLVIAEQNAVPGAANRLAGRVARVAATSFADTPLPKAVLTGNPVRQEILDVDRRPAARAVARAELGLPADGAVVAAVTGSLGARRVNQAVAEVADKWRDRPGVAIRHVTGERDWERFGTSAPAGGALRYQRVAFEARMDLLYAAVDVMVGRAGASTVAELAAAGVPSVLIPLPGAPGDHQTGNARNLERVGAAVVISDGDCDAARLARELDLLLSEPERLVRMGEAARRLARPHAAAAVASLIEEHSRVGKQRRLGKQRRIGEAP